jgi:hypothetical protein
MWRLLAAVVQEAGGTSVEEEHRELAMTIGIAAGFRCGSDKALCGLGAFISDLLKLQGPRTVDELGLAFAGWYGRGEESAALAEYGVSADELPQCLSALAGLLWDGGTPTAGLDGSRTCPTDLPSTNTN